jgi:microcystin-dependent protein
LKCDGQIISIASNNALYALLGTMYGGDGITTFALPDLRGRVPLHAGQGTGLTNRLQGNTYGSEIVTLQLSQMPLHTHTATVNVNVAEALGTEKTPGAHLLATADDGERNYSPGPPTAQLGGVTATIGSAGGSQPVEKLPPCQAVNFCIATEGVFPSRP